MSPDPTFANTIAVAGDVTVDWNIAKQVEDPAGASKWTGDYWTRACRQPGAAALLADVIAAIIQRLPSPTWRMLRMIPSLEDIQPSDPRYHHSYAMWSYQDAKHPAWRVESMLGLDRSRVGTSGITMKDEHRADVIVLDDAALGFREEERSWTALGNADGWQPWIVLKMARPVVQGQLWERLYTRHASRLIVLMTANDLRLSEVQISRELSWERTAQDLVEELAYNPKVNALSQCAHVVVSFGPAGAMLLTSPLESGHGGVRRLFFDPKVIEGMWERDYPGFVIGYNTCLAGGIVRQLLLAPGSPIFAPGIIAGLNAMRKLHREGYANLGDDERPQIVFPASAIAEALAASTTEFATADVPAPVRLDPATASTNPRGAQRRKLWKILEDHCHGYVEERSKRVAIDGADAALAGVPLGQFGSLLTVDRQEIESFRSVGSLVSEYCRRSNWNEPLSIAIFGAPGSGKSFGIIQVAKAVEPERIEVRQFNLSQFDSPADLLTALHTVRDIGLSGKIPLVFWDEFDTMLEGKPWGWLRYFLAPMQDGKFQEGQTTHSVGRAVFVFAGSTSYRMEDFGRKLETGVLQVNSDSEDETRSAATVPNPLAHTTSEFRAAKGPDFVSRLKGFVDILGPNPQRSAGETGTAPYHMIRRAILLRSILRSHAPNVFESGENQKDHLNIDPGVLRAFLQTREYRHGVRSMESIISMSLLADKRKFEQSSLPAEAQLDLHVDGEDFLNLMHQIELPEAYVDSMVKALHEVYCRSQNEATRFEDLLPEDKAQNEAYVRDIPNKLAQINAIMVPARDQQSKVMLADEDVELLAEREHIRWVKARLTEGWRYAPRKDKLHKLHPDLVPWRAMPREDFERLFSPEERYGMGPGSLPEKEREINRCLVRGIPGILASVNQALINLQPCVRVGVAGHRFLAEPEKIQIGVDEALRKVAERFPERSFTVFSSLAEGADRMIVERALAWPGARLVVPLPLPQLDYEKDFQTQGSMEAFRQLLALARPIVELPWAETREDAYVAVDCWGVAHCDVLVVLWDGQPAQGKAGTGMTVSWAMKSGKPIAWVHVGNRKPGTKEPTSLGEEQGRVELLGFD